MKEEPKEPYFNPGSEEAIDAGCSCPVLDNSHGLGYRRATSTSPALFIFNATCRLHTVDYRVSSGE